MARVLTMKYQASGSHSACEGLWLSATVGFTIGCGAFTASRDGAGARKSSDATRARLYDTA
jgi:hypothetical protein